MELRRLQSFIAVAEEAGFTRAAVRVHVAQPAISQQIAQLERELGQRLLDRTDRRIRLTPAGEAFLLYARTALKPPARLSLPATAADVRISDPASKNCRAASAASIGAQDGSKPRRLTQSCPSGNRAAA